MWWLSARASSLGSSGGAPVARVPCRSYQSAALEPQITKIDDHKMMAAAGPNCDRVAFTEYITRNVVLDSYRTKLKRSTRAIAHMIRGEVSFGSR